MASVDPGKTALLLIGFQRDYFDPKGILYSVVEESHRVSGTLAHTLRLIEAYKDTPMVMVNTPIVFSETYRELENPIGILKTIREVEAFKEGTFGAETIDEITAYGDRIIEVPGKVGFNAFTNTRLEELLRSSGVERVLLAGCVTSICVNATALQAFESGFDVTVLSDCTSSRTPLEQDFFCQNVFPLFSEVCASDDVLGGVGTTA
ncbi:MAG: cysteine hydrolase [Phycisphaerales bacterium]|nr:cysteine hydrolase [Phycisphaerales bacterium]